MLPVSAKSARYSSSTLRKERTEPNHLIAGTGDCRHPPIYTRFESINAESRQAERQTVHRHPWRVAAFMGGQEVGGRQPHLSLMSCIRDTTLPPRCRGQPSKRRGVRSPASRYMATLRGGEPGIHPCLLSVCLRQDATATRKRIMPFPLETRLPRVYRVSLGGNHWKHSALISVQPVLRSPSQPVSDSRAWQEVLSLQTGYRGQEGWKDATVTDLIYYSTVHLLCSDYGL